MKVFISWSQERSREIAKLLRTWIKCVIQASDPWVSIRDLPRGSRWMQEIGLNLDMSHVGIICLTKANVSNPWILFEAGALAKGVSKVCTLLIDLEPADVQPPLDQFNHTFCADEQSMWLLIETLNSELAPPLRLSESVLKEVFLTYWPKFETRFKEILGATETSIPTVETPDDSAVLSEVLAVVRSVSNRLARVESGGERWATGDPSETKVKGEMLAIQCIHGPMSIEKGFSMARDLGISAREFKRMLDRAADREKGPGTDIFGEVAFGS